MAKEKSKQAVVVRTYSAGVHVGYLESRSGTEVVLTESRRLWNWRGANTLNEVATTGVEKGSKVSVPVARNVLTEAIEIIDATEAAVKAIAEAGWTA